jgi:hypothetical protein
MPVSKVSFTGQTNGSGTFLTNFDNQNSLFLKVFAGEVLQTFETAAVMKPLHMIRTITSGKSAQFPVTGIASAKYHKPGTDILIDNGHDAAGYVTSYKHAEKIINIDDLLLATTFIDKLDEAKNHYDVRSIYSQELGRALAKQFDKNLLGLACLTAATFAAAVPTPRAANLTGMGAGAAETSGAGTVLDDATFNGGTGNLPTGGVSAFVNKLYDMAAAFDVKNIPSDERYCVVTPTTYYRLVNSDEGLSLVNTDYSGGSNGSYADARLLQIAGFKIVRSNNAAAVFGQDLSSAPTGANNTYGANFARVVGACFQKMAFGTVKLMDLSMESEYDIRLQGHMMVAKYAMGHGILRPECAGLLTGTA